MDKNIDVAPVIEWLVEGAPGAPLSQDILLHLAERMVECGLPICRAAVFVTTLHPNVMGRGFFWRKGNRDIEIGVAQYSILETEEYKQNPVSHVAQKNTEIRRHLADKNCPDDFLMLKGLREDGMTDYLIYPLEFTNGDIHAASWVTDQTGGFSEQQITALKQIRAPLSRIAEIMALKRVAMNLLDAYLGHQTGEKVLAGKIKLGDGEDIHAVIWFCDLRDSTALAEAMPRPDYLKLLNEYFDCMAGAVLDGGGEVLKFIGDAVLGIFPIDETKTSYQDTCLQATMAAKDAMKRMKKTNTERIARGDVALGYGIGLHLGDVMYGNVGTPERIDFSVIGASANEAARIESMTKTLNRNILISKDVARHLNEEWHSLGFHSLKGIGEKVELFSLPEAK
jgi:adenylate cyclase